MKRWTQVFKALANINRLNIIRILAARGPLTVSDVAIEINISLNAVSKHLILLYNLDVLESDGKQGHVYYSINPKMPADVQKAVNLFK